MKGLSAREKPSDEYHRILKIYKNASPYAMLILDRYTFIDCNKQACSLFDCSRRHILGKKPWELSPPRQPDGNSSRNQAVLYIQKALSGKPQHFEWLHLTSKGREFYVEVSINSARISNRKLLIVTLKDITKQKRGEEQLRVLWTAIENSGLSLIITDSDARITYASPFVSKLTGYSQKELLGKNPRILKSGLTPEKRYRELWKALKSGRSWHGVFINKRKNGSIFYEDAVISPVLDPGGKTIHYVGIKQDITRRVELENKLKEHSRLMSAYLNLVGLMIVVLDSNGKIQLLNRKAEEVLGVQLSDAIGKSWFSLAIPSPERAELRKYFRELLKKASKKSPDVFHHENFIVASSGKKRLVRWTNRLWLENGHVKSVIAVGEDITNRKRAEEELRRRYEELEIFKKVSVERELKMIDLEKKIEKLQKELSVLKKNKG